MTPVTHSLALDSGHVSAEQTTTPLFKVMKMECPVQKQQQGRFAQGEEKKEEEENKEEEEEAAVRGRARAHTHQSR